MMKDEVNSLLQKPMNRLDFLKHVGVGLAAVTGAAMVVKTMNGLGGNAKQQSVGYGSAVYGGKKDQQQPKAS